MLKSFIKTIYGLLLISSFLLSCSCEKEKVDKGYPAIAFTFDDNYIDSWYEQRELFRAYNIKATFYISRPHEITEDQFSKLKKLAADGHEVACHSMNHLNVVDYLYTHSRKEYLENEIIPCIDSLQAHGFNPASFAYPFGVGLPDVDKELLKLFTSVRYANWNYNKTTIDRYDEIYYQYNNKRTIDGIGIDNGYAITLDNFETGLERCFKRKECLIVYAHTINNSGDNFSISPAYLENCFRLIQTYGIRSVTVAELFD